MRTCFFAVMAFLGASACGDAPQSDIGTFDPNRLGGGWVTAEKLTGCGQPDQDELARYGAAPGYNGDGCTRSDRMADVRPFTADFGLSDGTQEPEPESDFGRLEQPITVSNGPGAAVSLTVKFKNGRINDIKTNGRCKPKIGWTTAEPIQDHCLVPHKVGTVDWFVSPDLYSSGDRSYMRDRMRNAWSVWSRTVTCSGSAGVFQRTTALKPASGSETTGGSTAQDNYTLTEIPVYPTTGTENVGGFAARTEMDLDVIESYSGAPNGVKYYGWKYSGIAVQHPIIEGQLWASCVDIPRDANAMTKLANAYTKILAHELGHVWGLAHTQVGIMRPGNQHSCAQLFTTDANVALNDATVFQRLAVNILRDSGGINTVSAGDLGPSLASCPADNSAALTGALPDMFFGQFF